MLIDWFTVVAQALNFLLLVWLMKRFLYQPVLRAVDAREKKIAAELADAATQTTTAKAERDDFQHKNEQFDQQHAELLAKATDEAQAERQRLIGEARAAADAIAAKRQEALLNDARNLTQAITRKAQDEVFAIARRTLSDLSGTTLEEQIAGVFTSRLRAMDETLKSQLGEAMNAASEPALIRSAFDLPEGSRGAIQTALDETFASAIRLSFETSPDLISGIELTANGQKVSWSISDYLKSLEIGVSELLKAPASP